MEKRIFKEVENMIYSYMDIFGIDFELSILMKKFEDISSVKLAISDHQQITKIKDAWYYSQYFNS